MPMNTTDEARDASRCSSGKVITCTAAVLWGPKEPFVLQRVRVDPPKKFEVRIKILYTSICHTDLSAWKGENKQQRAYPRILGHEASGVVESVGEGVEDIERGDHVITLFHGECGQCRVCKRGKSNLCERFHVDPMKTVMVSDQKSRFSTEDGKLSIYHFLNTSTFSEFTVLDAACAVKINPVAPLEKLTLLSCGVSTGVGAAWNAANVQADSTVAIFGLGAIGLAVAAGARARGVSKIIGVDINPGKFIKGKEVGITDFVNPNVEEKPVNEVIRSMTGGGVDYSFECVGNVGMLREAFLSTYAGEGVTVMLGIHATPAMLPFHPMELFQGRTLIASVFGGFKGKSQIPKLAEECLNGAINLDLFITHRLPFHEINQAFNLLNAGTSLRCLLHFEYCIALP